MDELLAQWRRERPDLDVAPLGVYGRLFRVVQLSDDELAKGLAPYGLHQGWFDLPAADSFPQGLAAGPDGNVWFAESQTIAGSTGRIGRITPTGTLTEFPMLNANTRPRGITVGPDGALWFGVSTSGSMDWLCLPRFDSASCFTALLGDERHGRWFVAPAGEVRTSSRDTTRRKPRSRATSSSTVPAPSASATRVHRVIARGPGSPDSTPSAKRPPLRLGRRPWPSAWPPPTALSTTMPPAPARKRRRDRATPESK